MGELSPWHLLILAAVFVILFGSRKLPDAARSIGRSMRILRAETSKGVNEEEEAEKGHSAQPQALQQAAAQPAPQPMQAPQQQPAQPAGDPVASGAPLSEAQRDSRSS